MASGQPWEYSLRKYLLLLATLVVTVTYAAGFNPPGGVWQDDNGHLNGDPIIRTTHYARYLVFFYCNATAFASSLVVIVLILVLAVLHDKQTDWVNSDVVPLRVVMVVDLLSLMGAYAAGTCRDTLTTVCSSLLVAAVFAILVAQMVLAWWSQDPDESATGGAADVPNLDNSDPEAAPNVPNLDDSDPGGAPIVQHLDNSDPSGIQAERPPVDKSEERFRKVLMLLATFAASVTYGAGLSAPGGFWDSTGGRHRPGDAILRDSHDVRLVVFLVCNTMAFVASLLIIVILLDKKLRKRAAGAWELYGCILGALNGLVGAYAAGSCRKTDTTVYVVSLGGAVLLYIVLHAAVLKLQTAIRVIRGTRFWTTLQSIYNSASEWLRQRSQSCSGSTTRNGHRPTNNGREALDKARSLVLLLATLAATITFTAGLDPPGGVWQDNIGHKAGDPILLMTNPRRYKAFFYCNSIAFVASLVAIVMVQKPLLVKHHALEAAMILDLFGLIGAYAAGSCRDLNTSIHAMALAGAVLIYVVIHVVFFTLDHNDGDDKKKEEELNNLVEKRRKRLLLFAILAATITYQAGLTPPGGFLLQDDQSGAGHHAGDPVLLYNFPRRYKAFFYCNTVSFMLSIALIILLVNPHLYRPAIRSNALSVCTAAGLFGLMGAYAAGSTQHIKTSIYIFALVGVVLLVAVGLLLVFLWRELKKKEESTPKGLDRTKTELDQEEAEKHARRKYLMLLGILVASVTYQAGLEPPGGAWQSSSGGYQAGDPVMHDTRRPQYLAFFYSNSTSFVASIVVIMLLLPKPLQESKAWLRVMNTTILLDLFALLVAYAAGSSRGWKTAVHVITLVLAVLGYFAIHMTLSFMCYRRSGATGQANTEGQGNGVRQEPRVVGL